MSEEQVTTPPETPPAPPPEAPPAVSWRDSLEPDLKDNPTLAKYDDVPGVAKALLEANTLIGKKGAVHPGEGATPEQMGTYFNSLGRPETVEGYELGDFKPPENIAEFWDTQGTEKMVGKMHELGLTKTQVRGILDAHAAHQSETMGDTLASIVEGKNGTEAALKEEWGLAYPGKTDLAKRVVTDAAAALEISTEDLAGIILPTGQLVGNSPVLTKMFAMIGESGAELKFLGDAKGGGRSTLTPEEADTEIVRLKAHPGYTDGRHEEHKAIITKLSALYEQKYPGEKE